MAQSDDDKLAQAVGAKLRQIREDHALSTGDLAARSGIAEKNIIEFEGGKSRPDGDQVIRLSQALNVVPSTFFTE
ncbi:helix-turn-helix domain-containing protein [Acetobacter estunensis]|uniref:helix-turn-helix domain-containing protein n=1 Tax=Acetobacter estunensis TaxID=104097 RepID=UPI001C2D66F8|nr:helix-turn-helix transcriptional regulator [Acetobacter estunensis]